ncbi:MAG: PadR family transcriptional regulator [Herpetosiphon sp.]
MYMSPLVQAPLGLPVALLGFLREKPVHGYEMHARLRGAGMLGRVWYVKQSHLYALLRRLEQEGLVAASETQQGMRPPRRLLSLTPQGAAAFAEWLTTPVAHGRDFRIEFMAKLYWLVEGGEDTAALIAQQRRRCAAWLEGLDEELRAEQLLFPRLVLEFRRGQVVAINDWLERCEELLSES